MQNRKLLKSTSISIGIVVFCAVTFYLVNCRAEQIRFRDVLGTEHRFVVDDVLRQNEIARELSGNFAKDKAYLQEKTDRLTEYLYAAIYAGGNYDIIKYWPKTAAPGDRESMKKLYNDYVLSYPAETPEEAEERLSRELGNYNAVLDRVDECENYGSYVRNIADNAQDMLDVSLFQENGWHRANIVKTQRDYYALEGITPLLFHEAGYVTALCFDGAPLASGALTIMMFLFLTNSVKVGRRKLLPWILLWALGIVMSYLVCFGISMAKFGLPTFGAPIQSLHSFRSCQYAVSCGAAAVCSIFLKMAGWGVLLCGGIWAYCHPKRMMAAIVPLAALAAELALSAYDGADRTLIFLREVNLFSAFSAERFFLRYLNLDLFSTAVTGFTVFLAAFSALFGGAVFLAYHNYTDCAARAYDSLQKAYYDEMNRRYDESRKIRHDIHNHLLALKLLLEKGDSRSAEQYIEEISRHIDQCMMPYQAGLDVVDALLCQKARQAEEIGGALSVRIECQLADCGISNYDLCGILGNIIDNAIEAVTSADDRTIKLFVGKQHDMLYISCENKYAGELKIRGNTYLTTKADPFHHGIGIPRVQEIAKRAGGEIRIFSEDGVFVIEILLNCI